MLWSVKMIFGYLFTWRKGEGGGVNVCVCVETHSQSLLLNHRMAFDETLVGMKYSLSRACVKAFSQISLGWIQGRAKIGHGVAPAFLKGILQVGRLQQHTECIAMIYRKKGRSAIIFCSNSFFGPIVTRVDSWLYLVIFGLLSFKLNIFSRGIIYINLV